MSSRYRTLSGRGWVTSDGAVLRDVAVAMRRPLPFIITNSKLPSPIPRINEKQRKLARRSILVRSSSGQFWVLLAAGHERRCGQWVGGKSQPVG